MSKRKADDLQHFLIVSLDQLENAVKMEYDTELNKGIGTLARIVEFTPTDRLPKDFRITAGMYIGAVEEEKKRRLFNKLLEDVVELRRENRMLRNEIAEKEPSQLIGLQEETTPTSAHNF